MGYVTYSYAKDTAFSLHNQSDKQTAVYNNDYCKSPEDGKINCPKLAVWTSSHVTL